ncbi:MAG: hypothetical protein HOO96_38495 [Polyangiaceae bacterium]|nr:hypothetical protein [Polyangiaceae bacterium]
MSYRDDQEALQERVGALESELAAANRKIAELSGTAPALPTGNGETFGRPSSLGAPTSLRLETVVDGELSAKGYEAIAALIRERLGLDTTQVGGRMATLHRPRMPAGHVEIVVRDGKTHLLLERSWAERSTGAWLFAGIIGLFGALVAGSFAHDMFHTSDAMSFFHALWAGPLLGAFAALILGPRARRKIEAEAATRRGAFAAMVQLAEEHCVKAKQVRVAVAEVEEPAEEELASESSDASLGIR